MSNSDLEQRAQEAMEKGEATQTRQPSKQAVLDLIKDDKADALSVSRAEFWIEDPGSPFLTHYAVRFNDRKLGEEVRAHTMRGFNLS